MDERQRRLIGLALQHTRKALGYEQVDIASVLSLSPSMVSWLETGRRVITLDEVRRLAEFWEMPYLTLLEKLGLPVDREAPTLDQWLRSRPDYTAPPRGDYSAPQSSNHGERSPSPADKTVLARAGALVTSLLSVCTLAVLQRQHA